MKDDLREVVARAICRENGDNFECIHRHKQHWQDHAGKDCAGRFRDVNALTQQDYLCLADAAIAAARPVIGEECAKVAEGVADGCSGNWYQATHRAAAAIRSATR